jgi:hypothetical protein
MLFSLYVRLKSIVVISIDGMNVHAGRGGLWSQDEHIPSTLGCDRLQPVH